MKIKGLLFAAFAAFASVVIVSQYVTAANEYGSGLYGACEYNNCGISISSNSSVSLAMTPTASGVCTVANDVVTVSTASSTGYSLQVSSSSAGTDLVRAGGGGSIPGVSGSLASPTVLSANEWGYRVDGTGGFGAGPTTQVQNSGIPSATFALVPALASPDTIVSTSAPTGAGHSTDVWYGACASTAIPAGQYSLNITYTAVVN